MQVAKLYELVEVDPAERQVYLQAWDLRRLYTFAWRRQRDSYKRGQTPREA